MQPVGPRNRALFYVLMAIATAGALELTARIAFSFLPGIEKTRAALSGELGPTARFQRSVGQAYLLYVPSPSHRDEFGEQHNAHGYRGPLVSLDRQSGVKRVLFMGGSTTYGWRVGKPQHSYPAQVGRFLAADLPKGVSEVEVINGGLPWGTTAELLTHYHFKFHYYAPDVVVINTGMNDAAAMAVPGYQPDYSHWRQPLLDVPKLAPFGRLLLRSRLLSTVLVPAYAGLTPNSFTVKRDGAPNISWYSGSAIPDDKYAFRHNLQRLIEMITEDGARVVLVPWRGVPGTHQGIRVGIERNEAALRDIAAQTGSFLAPFPASVISPKNWADNGHVNEPGAIEKAKHVVPFVRRALFD